MNRINNLISDTESLIIFSAIIVFTIIISWWIRKGPMNRIIKRISDSDADTTSAIFIRNIVQLTIYLIGFGWAFLSLPINRNFAHTFFAGAGVTTLIIGFSAQQILGNLISGLFIILNKPFRIGDLIEVQGNRGKVIKITWHDTIIENENKTITVIPNSVVTSNIINVL
jgi:small-conductance mechanosensitive channel